MLQRDVCFVRNGASWSSSSRFFFQVCGRVAPVRQGEAEAREPHERIAARVANYVERPIVEPIAEHASIHRRVLDGPNALVGVFPIVRCEVPELLSPLALDVFARRDVEDAQARVEIAHERSGTQSHVGLPHADLVGEVGETLTRENVVNGDGAL